MDCFVLKDDNKRGVLGELIFSQQSLLEELLEENRLLELRVKRLEYILKKNGINFDLKE